MHINRWMNIKGRLKGLKDEGIIEGCIDRLIDDGWKDLPGSLLEKAKFNSKRLSPIELLLRHMTVGGSLSDWGKLMTLMTPRLPDLYSLMGRCAE